MTIPVVAVQEYPEDWTRSPSLINRHYNITQPWQGQWQSNSRSTRPLKADLTAELCRDKNKDKNNNDDDTENDKVFKHTVDITLWCMNGLFREALCAGDDWNRASTRTSKRSPYWILNSLTRLDSRALSFSWFSWDSAALLFISCISIR